MSLAGLRKSPGRASTNRTHRSMSCWSVRGSYQVVGLAGRSPGHGPSVIALIVWIATPRFTHSAISSSASRAYFSPASCVALYGNRTLSNGKRSRLSRCRAATERPWPVTPMKRTRPSSRASTAASRAPPSRSAVSQSITSTRLCSWIRSTWSTPSRSSERAISSFAPR